MPAIFVYAGFVSLNIPLAMNATLLNPFNITYPTAVQTSLPAQACLARFDPSGRYIAAGRSTGMAVVWDLETRAIVRWLEGHVKGITNIECVLFA